MDRHSIDWTGAMPAITTPFTAEGAVDHEALAANIRRQMKAGATGVVAAGCTGEFWSLTHEERAAIGATARKAVGDKGTVILGAAAITPGDVLSGLELAHQAGCDGALVMPPFFAHLSRAEVLAHYRSVAEATPLPIMLYNIPGNAGNALTPDLVDELADLEPVVAIKESSGDWLNFHRTLSVAGDRLRVFCGPSSTIGVPAIEAGCDGLIDCFPNVWHRLLDLWSLVKRGENRTAWEIQASAQEMTTLFTTGGRMLYPATKAAMDYLGLPGGGAPRPPLQPLTGAPLKELERELDRILERKDTAA
ncbi:dihydrodipicolinate synthase family protein [Roseivivax sp.]